MNGQEYTQLFQMAQEARDASLAALAGVKAHGKRLDTLEEKVDANAVDLAVGRFGLRATGVVGSLLIGLGGMVFGFWKGWGGDGPS